MRKPRKKTIPTRAQQRQAQRFFDLIGQEVRIQRGPKKNQFFRGTLIDAQPMEAYDRFRITIQSPNKQVEYTCMVERLPRSMAQ